MKPSSIYSMRRSCVFLIVSLAFALCATTARAQTHPCDQATSPTVTILSGAPYRVQFCSPQTDNPEAIKATVDQTVYDNVPVTAKTGPSATGLVLYETAPFFQVAKGLHSLTIATYNRNALTGQLQIGASSTAFPFAGVDDTPPPSAPIVKGLIKG